MLEGGEPELSLNYMTEGLALAMAEKEDQFHFGSKS